MRVLNQNELEMVSGGCLLYMSIEAAMEEDDSECIESVAYFPKGKNFIFFKKYTHVW